MHGLRSPYDSTPECMHDPLVAQAYSKYGNLRPHIGNDLRTYAKVARIFRTSRSWGNNDAIRIEVSQLVEGQLIIAIHEWPPIEFGHVLIKIVCERVIVIEDDDFHDSYPWWSIGVNVRRCRVFFKASLKALAL